MLTGIRSNLLLVVTMMTMMMMMMMMATTILAFSPTSVVVRTTTPTTTRTSSSLFSTSSSSSSTTSHHRTDQADRVTHAGCGLPVVPSGNRYLFDPAAQGMLEDGSLNSRVQEGSHYQFVKTPYLPRSTGSTMASSSSSSTTTTTPTIPAQAWLEDWDDSVPPVFAKPKAPITATVLGRTKLISEDAPGDIQHVVLQLPHGFHYVEGQSISVIPPGINPKTNRPHAPRLYSIASTRYGDLLNGQTVSLCVRRAEFYEDDGITKDPTKQGVCSTLLCNAVPGQSLQVAGPVGKTMLLPNDPTTDIIMIATGTGVAPFRAFLHRLFVEQTIARHTFTGRAWLILGVPTTGGLLYPQEFQAMQEQDTRHQLQIDYAISREQVNKQGGKLYVQDVLAEQAKELWDRMENGAHLYICGLKGMMPGILQAMEQVAASQGVNDWNAKLAEYKANGQWHVEVY